MALNPYVKSAAWLLAFGGLGYGLMRLTEPSEEKLKEIRKTRTSANLSEEEKKKLLFFDKLKEATESKPIYMQKKDR